MNTAGAPAGNTGLPPPIRGPETLSQLLARILDQLSVGAWLPAAALVFLLLLVGDLRHEHGNLREAISSIASMSIASVALLVGAVVLATMVTQAFAFEGIRLVEGYWGPGRLRTKLADVRCHRHLSKRNKLMRRKQELERSAFSHARQVMLERNVPRAVVDFIEEQRAGTRVARPSDRTLKVEAAKYPWQRYASPDEVRKIADLLRALRDYPESEALILPTRFGNTIRAYEERAINPGAGNDPEGFVQAVFHELPLSIQIDHEQVRSRLDLYTSLIVVFVVTGLTGVGALACFGLKISAATVGLTVALTWLSYRAAIASARAYGSVLKIIADLTRPLPEPGIGD